MAGRWYNPKLLGQLFFYYKFDKKHSGWRKEINAEAFLCSINKI